MAFFPAMKITLNGDILTQAQNVTVSYEPALNPVNTQAGRSGYSEGGRFMTFQGSLAIPKAGPQFNPSLAMANREEVDVQAFVANLSCATTGVFTAAELSWSTEAETTYSFTIEADFVPMT